jgi:Acetyltransferase (GNAT) domain
MIGEKAQQNPILVRVTSPTDAYWQQVLQTIPHDFYHLPGYLELEATRHSASAEAMIISDGARVFLLPYLVRDCSDLFDFHQYGLDRIYDIVSPYGYPGILVNKLGESAEFIQACLEITYNNWRDRNICSAFIRLHPILNSYIDTSFSDCKFIFCSHGNVVTCDLSKETGDIWKQIRSNHRTKIKKLVRAGFTVKIVPMDRYLEIFMDIYRETMDRVHASSFYYFTPTYFERLSQILDNSIQICIVEIDGQVIAASLITELSGIVQYYLGGTRTAFLPQSPATIMFNYIIDWAKHRNNQYFNLGGGFGGNQDSLYHFKAGFSKEVKPFTTIRTIVDQEKYERLTSLRADHLGVSSLEIKSSSFFPAYRSG